ncbi:MAG: hypothetical protein R3F11_02305 [Verrucomicrobiales bacterium]
MVRLADAARDAAARIGGDAVAKAAFGTAATRRLPEGQIDACTEPGLPDPRRKAAS